MLSKLSVFHASKVKFCEIIWVWKFKWKFKEFKSIVFFFSSGPSKSRKPRIYSAPSSLSRNTLMFGNLKTEFYEIKALFMDSNNRYRTPIGPFLHSYVSLMSTYYSWVPFPYTLCFCLTNILCFSLFWLLWKNWVRCVF